MITPKKVIKIKTDNPDKIRYEIKKAISEYGIIRICTDSFFCSSSHILLTNYDYFLLDDYGLMIDVKYIRVKYLVTL